MNYPVQDRPITMTDRAEQFIGSAVLDATPVVGLPLAAGDAVSSFSQAHPRALQSFMQGTAQNPLGSMFGFIPGANILQGIFQMLQQLLNEQNQGTQGNPFGFGDDERYFQNANGGSVGDPHLSFNGSTWDNMGSQPDLLHSDSFDGGYQLSTQTTPPAANGVSYNQEATVTTNYGGTSVTMDKSGNVSISQLGNSFSLQAGQSVDLDNGEFVQRNADGSLQITLNNGAGGTISTTMRSNGTGVDVNTTAANVDLGGTLVAGAGGHRTLAPMEHMRRWTPSGTPLL